MLKRILQILLILILVGLIGLLIFITYIYYDTKPVLEANIGVNDIANSTEIIRDDAGIPHIFARNDIDAYFSLGYAVAQDRLWQMEVLRLIAYGKASEILGDKYSKLDKTIRILQIPQRANDIYEKVLLRNNEEHYIKSMRSYLNGINTYLDQIKNDLPIEFRILHYKPKLFRLQDMYTINGLIRYAMTYDKLYIIQMIEKHGVEKASEILPLLKNMNSEEVYNLSDECSIDISWKRKGDLLLDSIIPSLIGNTFAISGKKTDSSSPLLFNNIITSDIIPNIFYEAHIATPQQNFYGFFLPLSPFGYVGHNENISWGITNLMVDDTDYYIETLHPNNPNSYKYDGEWKQMDIQRERIEISNKKEDEAFFSLTTLNGVVLSLLNCDKAISFKWGYYDDSFIVKENGLRDDWFKTFYILNHSENYKQFREGLSYYWGAAIDIAYADSFGNIVSNFAGQIPKREENSKPYMFLDNSDSINKWIGYFDFYELPSNINPERNYIIHSNSYPIDFHNMEYYTSFFYYKNFRYDRVEELLTNHETLNLSDFQKIYEDPIDPVAKKFLPIILKLLKEDKSYSYTQEDYQMIDILDDWDYKIDIDGNESIVFNELYYQLIVNTLKDDLGNNDLNIYLQDDLLYTNFSNLIENPDSEWFDNKNTLTIENLELVLKKSLTNSHESIKSKYGNNLDKWEWGNTHKIKFKHFLSDIFPYNLILNSKEVPLNSSFESINKSSYNINSLYMAKHISGVKFIGNMQNTRISLFSMAIGNSGHFHNENYLDQMDDWFIEKSYRDPSNSKEEVFKVMENRIKLIPSD